MRPDHDKALTEYRRKAEMAEAVKSAHQAELKSAAKEKAIPPPRPDNMDVPDEPRPPRIWIADSTIEELQAQLAANPRGLIGGDSRGPTSVRLQKRSGSWDYVKASGRRFPSTRSLCRAQRWALISVRRQPDGVMLWRNC
jgi:hypothetical protein